MLEAFQMQCPTKDKEVTLIVDYFPSTTLSDSTEHYSKGRIHSCSENDYGCDSYNLHSLLPDEITR